MLHLMYFHQYPKMACYLRADEGVWSPSDKVPKRVETVRWKPIRKFCPVKGKDLINMVKLIKESHAPSLRDRPTGTIRSKRVAMCSHDAARLQVSNVPARNWCAAGVQIPPKLITGLLTRNVEKLPLRHVQHMAGKTVRHAFGVVVLRGWKKQKLLCNEADRAWDMAQSKIDRHLSSGSRCPRPTGVPLQDNLKNLQRWESK